MNQYTTLRDVAKMAGTTVATASYVLNKKAGRYISEKTKKSVLDAAHKLDYIKCGRASALKGKSSRLVAILVPQFENQFFTRIIAGAGRVFKEHGYDMVICDTHDIPEQEHGIIRRMLQQRIDGMLLIPTDKGIENTSALRRLGVKLVALDRPMGEVGVCSVASGNYRAGFDGASHLMEKGHSNIAYIGWKSGIADLDKRRQAVFDAAKKFGLTDENIVVAEGDFSEKEGYRLTDEVLNSRPDVSAFFYGFNVQALGGIKCLKDRNRAIPRQVSVILIGSPEWAKTGNNNFTHIDLGEHILGEEGAGLLMEMLLDREKQVDKQITCGCSLVEGTSVGVWT